MSRIFIDMDGVLADFFGEIERLQNVEHYSQIDLPDTINKIKGTDFFSKLPKLPNADFLIQNVIDIFGEYSILSAPLEYDETNTIKHKHLWIEKHLVDFKPKEIIFSKDKHKYAKGNILIDDHRPNINMWEQHGGIGIKYKAVSKNYTVHDIISRLQHIKLR